MCTGLELTAGQSLLASAAMSGVGLLMQQQAAEEANNERQSILNAAQDAESKLNEKKAATIEDFTQQVMAAPQRTARYEKAATTREGELTKALQDAGGGSVDSSGYGKVSEDYTRAKADATASAADDIMKRARASARTSAAGGMYDEESMLGGDLSSNVAGITSASNRNNRYTRSALGGVNDTGSLVGGLLSGLAPSVGGMGKPAKP